MQTEKYDSNSTRKKEQSIGCRAEGTCWIKKAIENEMNPGINALPSTDLVRLGLEFIQKFIRIKILVFRGKTLVKKRINNLLTASC